MKIHRPICIFPCLALAILIYGCVLPLGPGPRASQSNTKDAFGIRATLWTNHYCYEWGEPTQVHFSLENISDESILLGGKDGLPFDIIVHRTTAEYEMSWANANTLQDEIELRSGEIYEIEWLVTLPDRENDYRIYGDLGPENSDFNIPLTISISQFCPESGPVLR
jgi:hypothetical protein